MATLVKPVAIFRTTIDEHMRTDKNSSIYKHLNENEDCFESFTFDFFSILDTTRTGYQLKIKQPKTLTAELIKNTQIS